MKHKEKSQARLKNEEKLKQYFLKKENGKTNNKCSDTK